MQRVEHGQSPVETVFDLDTDDLKTQFVGERARQRPGRSIARRTGSAFDTSIDADFGGLSNGFAPGN